MERLSCTPKFLNRINKLHKDQGDQIRRRSDLLDHLDIETGWYPETVSVHKLLQYNTTKDFDEGEHRI